MLSRAEKTELLELAASEALRSDMRLLRRRSGGAEGTVNLEGYIRFAATVARLSNHARRPFRRTTGTQFRL